MKKPIIIVIVILIICLCIITCNNGIDYKYNKKQQLHWYGTKSFYNSFKLGFVFKIEPDNDMVIKQCFKQIMAKLQADGFLSEYNYVTISKAKNKTWKTEIWSRGSETKYNKEMSAKMLLAKGKTKLVKVKIQNRKPKIKGYKPVEILDCIQEKLKSKQKVYAYLDNYIDISNINISSYENRGVTIFFTKKGQNKIDELFPSMYKKVAPHIAENSYDLKDKWMITSNDTERPDMIDLNNYNAYFGILLDDKYLLKILKFYKYFSNENCFRLKLETLDISSDKQTIYNFHIEKFFHPEAYPEIEFLPVKLEFIEAF